MSREITPECLLEFTGSHWKIENSLHWVLDVIVNRKKFMPFKKNFIEVLTNLLQHCAKILHFLNLK